ncbi:MAG: hypothetical protein ACK5UG_12285, partial [Synechococcaceae cyanobacterium]
MGNGFTMPTGSVKHARGPTMPYSSSIQIVNDANGTAHAFLADNGNLWHCQWNAEAQRWDKGSIV